MEDRVQKIIAQWGIASRRQAEEMILAGRVSLNGQIVQLGQKADIQRDNLEIDGQRLQLENRPQSIYLLLHKPSGVVSTCKDPQNRPTVLGLLPRHLSRGQGIHPVGRLDRDSTGALLLTNDGNLTVSLTHPRYHIPKTYHVWVQGHPSESILNIWRQGVVLSGQKTLEASVEILTTRQDKTLLEIILTEGKNRQIRRIAEDLGFKVLKLHRISIGPIHLNPPRKPSLPRGHYRTLHDYELRFLQNHVHLASGNITADTKENCL